MFTNRHHPLDTAFSPVDDLGNWLDRFAAKYPWIGVPLTWLVVFLLWGSILAAIAGMGQALRLLTGG